jgi:hypothetical protein
MVKKGAVTKRAVYCRFSHEQKNAGLATVTLISAPNPVSQVLW